MVIPPLCEYLSHGCTILLEKKVSSMSSSNLPSCSPWLLVLVLHVPSVGVHPGGLALQHRHNHPSNPMCNQRCNDQEWGQTILPSLLKRSERLWVGGLQARGSHPYPDCGKWRIPVGVLVTLAHPHPKAELVSTAQDKAAPALGRGLSPWCPFPKGGDTGQ